MIPAGDITSLLKIAITTDSRVGYHRHGLQSLMATAREAWAGSSTVGPAAEAIRRS